MMFQWCCDHVVIMVYLLQNAMEIIGFSPEEISSIFELLAAILNIGNITFDGYSLPDGTTACNMQNIEGI